MKMLFALITLLIEMNFQTCFGINSSIIEAQMDFALNLLRASSDNGQSTVISPLLINYKFAMVYPFAEGDTKREIQEVLAKEEDQHSFKNYLDDVISLYNVISRAHCPTLHMENKLFVPDSISLSYDFSCTMNDRFRYQVVKVNFVPAINELLKETRAQRDQHSAGKIVDSTTVGPRSAYLLNMPSNYHQLHNPFKFQASGNPAYWLNMLTKYYQLHNESKFQASERMTKPVLLSISDVHCKGTWEFAFNSNNTENRTFFASPNEQLMLPMMQVTEKFPYYEDNEVQTVIMWYSDLSAFMLIILPKNTYGLADLEKNLDSQKITQYVNAEMRDVKIVLPKFSLERQFSLAEPLTTLGLRTTFNKAANFSGISSDRRTFIAHMQQMVKIQVNENAARYPTNAEFNPVHPPTLEFIADHSFMFMVFGYNRVVLLNGRFTGTD